MQTRRAEMLRVYAIERQRGTNGVSYCSHCHMYLKQRPLLVHYRANWNAQTGRWKAVRPEATLRSVGMDLAPLHLKGIPFLSEQPENSPVWTRSYEAVPLPSLDMLDGKTRVVDLDGAVEDLGTDSGSDDDYDLGSGAEDSLGDRGAGDDVKDWYDRSTGAGMTGDVDPEPGVGAALRVAEAEVEEQVFSAFLERKRGAIGRLAPRADRYFDVPKEARVGIPKHERRKVPGSWSPMVYILILVLSIWASRFNIGATAMGWLFKLVDVHLAFGTGDPEHAPLSLHNVRRELGQHERHFHEYAMCPACTQLYELHELSGERCKWKPKFARASKGACNAEISKEVRTVDGIVHRPLRTYAYHSVRRQISKMLQRPGFEKKLEHWRTRQRRPDELYDLYDGRIWSEFGGGCDDPVDPRQPRAPAGGGKPQGDVPPVAVTAAEKHMGFGPDGTSVDWPNVEQHKANFFKQSGRYGLMLNIDGFQPFSKSQYSLTAVYLVWANLPMHERYQRENVMLVGLIPDTKGCKDPYKESMNNFLRPMVDELLTMFPECDVDVTYEFPNGRQIGIVLLVVACDLPAARKVPTSFLSFCRSVFQPMLSLYNTQHVTHNTQHAPCNIQHATHHIYTTHKHSGEWVHGLWCEARVSPLPNTFLLTR